MKLQRTPLLLHERTDDAVRQAFRTAKESGAPNDALRLAQAEFRATGGRGDYRNLEKLFGITNGGKFKLGLALGQDLKFPPELEAVVDTRLDQPMWQAAMMMHIMSQGGRGGPPVVVFAIEADLKDNALSKRLSGELAKVLNRDSTLRLSGKWVSDFSTEANEFIAARHPFDEKAAAFWKQRGQ